MRKTLLATVLWMGGFVAGLEAQAPAALRLSFADAIARSSGTIPAVEIASLRTDQANARVKEARGALLPSFQISGAWVNRTFNSQSIGFTGNLFPIPKLVGPFNNYDGRFTATQAILDLSSMARVRAAHAQVEGSTAEQRVAIENTAQSVAVAYLRTARAAALADARRQDSTIAAELVRLAEAQKAAGVSAAIDVTRARTQLAIATGQLILARNETETSRIALARALGLDPATRIELSDTLSAAVAAIVVPQNRDSAVAEAISNRPDLRAEIARGAAARKTGDAISAERLPRLSVEGDYGWNGLTVPGAIPTNQLAVSINIPLLDGFRREGRIAEQNAIAQESSVRQQDLQHQIAAEVDGALLDIHSATAQELIAAERLRLALEELSEARQRFAAGVAGNIEVINAQSSLILARDVDIQSRYSHAAARVALARAFGVAQSLR